MNPVTEIDRAREAVERLEASVRGEARGPRPTPKKPSERKRRRRQVQASRRANRRS